MITQAHVTDDGPVDVRRPVFVDDSRLERGWPQSADDWQALAYCGACGLATLRLFMHSAAWVVRRVERIEFLDDRTVRRKVSLDYVVPPGGPVLRCPDGTTLRLLPLALMRRKTLVNFDFQSHEGRAMSLLGLRENQAVTLGIVRAWAAVALGTPPVELFDAPLNLPPKIDRALEHVVAGDQGELHEAYERLQDKGDEDFSPLAKDDCFRAVLDRMADSFLLFGLDDGLTGRRRILKLSYDEPLTLRFRKSGFGSTGSDDPEPAYGPGDPIRWWQATPRRAALGRIPTTIRFPVPAAELAESFHFEVAAPPRVAIVEAALLAGRPNLYARPDSPERDREWYRSADKHVRRPRRRPSYDRIRGAYPTVNLHVVDVPYGSLSRAQVSLQPRPSGWLGTAFLSAWLATATLWAAWAANPHHGDTASVVLVTFAAAMVAVLARPDPHSMVTRLLAGVRLLAVASAALTVAGAVVLAFTRATTAHTILFVFAVLSVVPSLLVTRSYAWSRLRLRDPGARQIAKRSPAHRPVIAATSELEERFEAQPTHERPWYARQVKELRDLLYGDEIGESPWEQHRPGGPRDDRHTRGAHVEFASGLDRADYPYETARQLLGFDQPAIRVESSEGTRERFTWSLSLAEEFFARLEGLFARPIRRRGWRITRTSRSGYPRRDLAGPSLENGTIPESQRPPITLASN